MKKKMLGVSPAFRKKPTLSKKYNKLSIWIAYLHNFRKRKLKVFSSLLN
uniref:Uncharacterized protein n=1 Tax=biofilter metagenome TaxID=1070537 RepID=A0A193SBQ0_9ZZZZ